MDGKPNPLVTIITVVYNGEAHLAQTIESVLNQDYSPIEYLIIDGGSTDNTLTIIGQYESRISGWISEKDRGIADAFNKGLRLAKGEIIGIINADDWYEPGAVQLAVNSLADADVAYGDMRFVKDDKTDFVLRGDHHYLDKEMTINHPTVFVKRRCYEEFGYFDVSVKCAMDYDLLLRFQAKGCRFQRIGKITANMRWGGLSDARWMLGCRETLAIKNKYFPARKWRNRLYFIKHVSAIATAKFLSAARLDFIIKAYRSKLSRVKKIYE